MARRQRKRRRERREEHAKRRGWQTRHSVITGAGVTAGAMLGLAAPALGAPQTFYVEQTGDAGDGTCDATCTLRDAIDDANANTNQYDYVFFQPTVTGNVALTAGQIPITDSVYIYGNGPDVNTITAAPNSRIFDVNPGAGDFVGIYDVTLTGGNVVGNGGAVRNDDGILRIADAVLSGNTASGVGGAVFEPGNYNGGAYDRFVYATFSGNHADSGGAIYATNSWGQTRQATFSGNSADNGYGGAIQGDAGYLIDSTISGNAATVSGGGAAVLDEIRFYGTILANNTAGASAPDVYAPLGGFGSFDLVENVGPLSTPPSIITGQDPQLGPLGANGGGMPTLKPAASSPVVDQSYSYYGFDQRFGPRVVDNPNKANVAGGNGADIGALELSVAEGPQATPAPPPPPPVVQKKKKKCKKKKHKRSAQVAKKCKKKKKRSASSSNRIRFAMPSKMEASWPGDLKQHPFRLGH
jgi:predicted outer membrane repeat protein